MDNKEGAKLVQGLWFFGGIVLTLVVGAVSIGLLGQGTSAGDDQSGAAIAIRLIQSAGAPSLSALAPIVLSGLSALVAIVAVYASIVNTDRSLKSAERNAVAERQRAANERELERLEATLGKFHTPYLVRSQANNNMAQDLRDRLDKPDYRMLVSLLDTNWYDQLSTTDKAIVDEVCMTGEKLQAFIETRAGDLDPSLAEHLARAVAHFRMLKLAHEGKLGSDTSVAAKYVYPKELDLALKADRERLLTRIALLRAEPDKAHGVIEGLDLPDNAKLKDWLILRGPPSDGNG